MISNTFNKMKEKNKQFPVIFGVIVVIILILAFGWSKNRFFNAESTDDAFIDGHIIAVSPRVSGHISKVYITDNQSVHKDDPLFDIDESDYAVSVTLAKANFDVAQAEVEQTQKDFARYEKLLASGDISDQKYDEAGFRLQTSMAKRNAAQAHLKQAQLDLSYTKVKSPVTGRIARKSVEEGAFVQIGQGLVAIVPPERWVTANFKETQITHIQPGQNVTIKVDAYSSITLSGHVDSLQQGTGSKFSLLPAENATGNFIKVVQRVPVKILFDSQPSNYENLPLGLSVIPSVKLK